MSSSRCSIVSLQRWMNMFALKRLKTNPSVCLHMILSSLEGHVPSMSLCRWWVCVFFFRVFSTGPPPLWASVMTCVSVFVLLLFTFFWFTAEKMTLFSDPGQKKKEAGFLLCAYRYSSEMDLKELMNPVSCWLPHGIGGLQLLHISFLYMEMTADVPAKYELFPDRKQRCWVPPPTPPTLLVLFSCRALAEVAPPDTDPGPQACLTGP